MTMTTTTKTLTSSSRLAFVSATVIVMAVIAACADFSSPEDPTGGLPDVVVANPSFATNIQPMFNLRCAQGGCHTPASARGGLVLSAGASYANLVNVQSTLSPGTVRVAPGAHANSWLWVMIQPDSLLHPNLPRMPLAAVPLTANQIQTIVNWIDNGALNN